MGGLGAASERLGNLGPGRTRALSSGDGQFALDGEAVESLGEGLDVPERSGGHLDTVWRRRLVYQPLLMRDGYSPTVAGLELGGVIALKEPWSLIIGELDPLDG